MTAAAPATDRAPRLGPVWIAVYLALLLAIAALAAWVFFLRQPPVEYRDVPGQMSAEDREKLEQGLVALADRQKEIDALMAALGEDICPPGQVKLDSLPTGTEGGNVRQRGNAANQPAISPAPTVPAQGDTGQATAPDTLQQTASLTPLSTANLRDRLRLSTAFIVTPVSESEIGSGTGFFIAPEMLMTNRHVIEGAKGGEVFVTSKSLGQLRKGKVVKMSTGSEFGEPDFALVHVPGANQTGILPLTFSFDALQPVVAAGYPSAITDSDISKQQLFNGDMGAAPALIPGTAAERAEVRRLSAWFDEKFAAEVTSLLVGEKVQKRFLGLGEPSSQAIRAGLANIGTHMAYIDFLAERRTWLAGDSFSIADVAAAAHLSCVDYIGDVPWEDHGEAKQWYARVKSRPSFRPLLSDHIPGLKPPAHYADLDF